MGANHYSPFPHTHTRTTNMQDPTPSLETFHIPVEEVSARIKHASDRLDSFVRDRATAFASSSSEAQQESQRHAGMVL